MRSWVWIFLPLLAGCASSSRPIPAEWLAVPHAAPARLAPGPHDSADVKIEGGKIVADGKALTPAFAAIDSFSVSLQRREVVFSAKRSDNFDIGLVSLDGGEIHWFPADPADRLIYATAIESGSRLVTKDRRLREHRHPRPVALW